ncbi:hypothetical protein I4U23_015717 [Adineta vaga]|nr:hypothetical protein I4U23_015717 [Adineta vaga]
MLGSFVPLNTVTIHEHFRCCRSKQFDLDFPAELSGTIHPAEFYQSINNINYARKRTFSEKILFFLFTIVPLVGFISFIVPGLVLIAYASRPVWITLIAIGGAMLILLICPGTCINVWISKSRLSRLKYAVEAESINYLVKRPIPSRWRLDSYIYRTPNARGGSTTYIVYSLKIEIGQKISSGPRGDALKPQWNLLEPISSIGPQQSIIRLSN